jgi:hypothetical protein
MATEPNDGFVVPQTPAESLDGFISDFIAVGEVHQFTAEEFAIVTKIKDHTGESRQIMVCKYEDVN